MQISAEPVHFQTNPQLGEFLGIPIREDVLFTNQKGEANSGARKHAEKLMTKLQDPIRRVLQKDEQVFYIAQAQVPLEHLCPECVAALVKGVYVCSRCATTFKNEATLLRRALIIPGGGYFYCRLTILGILAGLVEALLLLEIIVSLGASQQVKGSSQDFIAGFAFFIFLVVLEKGAGYMHCRTLVREFIVEERKQFAMSASS